MEEKSVGVFDFIQTLGDEMELLLILYKQGSMLQTELADRLEISPTYLSRRLSPLKEKKIVKTEKGESTGGRPPEVIELESRTREMLQSWVSSYKPQVKEVLKDKKSFNELVDYLLDPNVSKDAADLIQESSRRYRLPREEYFFHFISKNISDQRLEPNLRVLLNAARYFLQDYDDAEKLKLGYLEEKIKEVVDGDYPSSTRREAQLLLDQLNIQDQPWGMMKAKYLDSIINEDLPLHLYRETILRKHRDRLQEAWLELLGLIRSTDDQGIRSRAREELSLLR